MDFVFYAKYLLLAQKNDLVATGLASHHLRDSVLAKDVSIQGPHGTNSKFIQWTAFEIYALMHSTRDAFSTGIPCLTSIVSDQSSITVEEVQYFTNNRTIET